MISHGYQTSNPDGQQRQPPVRRHDPDLMGAETGLPVDDQNAAVLRQKLRNFERPSNPPIFVRSISTASQDENLNG